MTELDERKAAVLRAIVEQYVDTAQPVGSQTVTSTTRSRRLGRHGPQRDVAARTRGLHRPAPPFGRAGPDRPRLPLLRRPPRGRGPAARDRTPPHRRVLQQCDARHGPAARPDEPAARAGDRRTRPSSSGPRQQAVVVRAANLVLAAAPGRARGRGALERLRREGSRRLRRRRHRRRRRRGQCALRRAALRPTARRGRDRSPRADARRPRSAPSTSADIVDAARTALQTRLAGIRASRSTSAARAGSRPSTTRSSRPTPRVCSSCSNSTWCWRR